MYKKHNDRCCTAEAGYAVVVLEMLCFYTYLPMLHLKYNGNNAKFTLPRENTRPQFCFWKYTFVSVTLNASKTIVLILGMEMSHTMDYLKNVQNSRIFMVNDMCL